MYRFIPSLRLILCGGVSVACLAACATQAPISPELAQCAARPDRFIPYENDTVLDTCTQLMWMTQDYRNIEGEAPRRWPIALAWADTMNQQRYGGYTDWRVPL